MNFRLRSLFLKRIGAAGSLILVLLASFSQFALAATAIVSQGFTTTASMSVGMVVSRDPTKSQAVVLSDSKNRDDLVGVVINPNDSLVAYNGASSKIQVATSGIVLVNSSTINGEIKRGDYLTASPIAGVAMKATESGKVVGVAQADLLNNSTGVEKKAIKDKFGRGSEVAIGQVAAVVELSDWTSPSTSSGNAFLDTVQSLAQAVTGRDVAPVRAIIGATLILIAMLISAIILYSSISSSIRSIGRNPLSHSMIKRSLLLVVIVVLLIMIAAFTIAYIIIGR